jgi:RimJ/RimL family protein N-acetyltransferase
VILNKNIVLENERVLLKPLSSEHFDGFCQIAFDSEVWTYMADKISNEDDLKAFIDSSLTAKTNGQRYPFTIFDKQRERIAGSTSFLNISEKDSRLEIGYTWLGMDFQGTGLNTRCKYELLKYAFDEMKFERVEFKTDFTNPKSRKALLKIGGKEEGVLRSHMLMHDGRRRDSIYYSILKNEWTILKKDLLATLKK